MRLILKEQSYGRKRQQYGKKYDAGAYLMEKYTKKQNAAVIIWGTPGR